VFTTNAIYRCEELEDCASVYDSIVEETDYGVVTAEKLDNVYLDILSDETEECDQGTKPQLPKPRTETASHEQDRDYEGLKERKPEHVYLQLLSDESQEFYQRTKDQNEVQDTKAQDEDSKREEQANNETITIKSKLPHSTTQNWRLSINNENNSICDRVELCPSADDQTSHFVAY